MSEDDIAIHVTNDGITFPFYDFVESVAVNDEMRSHPFVQAALAADIPVWGYYNESCAFYLYVPSATGRYNLTRYELDLDPIAAEFDADWYSGKLREVGHDDESVLRTCTIHVPARLLPRYSPVEN